MLEVVEMNVWLSKLALVKKMNFDTTLGKVMCYFTTNGNL